ncbi:MAG: alpha/beta hydrolase [Candidatus Uhrbacteria bacterium]|nr:alpha/beta hydrolase [Candidatus Uhrbacteria bacterium]
MKRAVIVHGWDGFPEECWFPWLKGELEARGFVVTVPQMPEAAHPNIDTWVPALARAIGTPDESVILIGHSMGVQAILRYLASIDVAVGGVVAVAGFFKLIPHSIGTPEDEMVADPWLTTPIDTDKVKNNARKIIAIFSDDDRFVPLDNVTMFEGRLGAETITLHGRGHMGSSDDALTVPEILEAVLGVSI